MKEFNYPDHQFLLLNDIKLLEIERIVIFTELKMNTLCLEYMLFLSDC